MSDPVMPLERYVEVPGGRVWTESSGDEEAETILVLHGGPGMPSYYLQPLAGLADEHRVVLFDQLGCGRSGRPDDPALWTLERAVHEVEAVRTGLGLGRVHLLGHSWGGLLALAYAAEHPAQLRSMVLSSPLVSTADWLADTSAIRERLPHDVRDAIDRHEREGSFRDPEYVAAVEAFNRRFFCNLDPWPESLQRTFAEMGQQAYEAMWGPSEFTQAGNLRGVDLTDSLPAVDVPTLWTAGTEDEVLPETLRRFAALAGGDAVVFDGGSHCLHLEQTDRYLASVRTFLTSDVSA